jgi:hypothetical protein
VNHLPPSCRVYYSKRLQSYSPHAPRGPIDLCFSDGWTTTCDVLVGADGIHSIVRTSLLACQEIHVPSNQSTPNGANDGDPVWAGMVCYRALISADKLRKLSPSHSVNATTGALTWVCRPIIPRRRRCTDYMCRCTQGKMRCVTTGYVGSLNLTLFFLSRSLSSHIR